MRLSTQLVLTLLMPLGALAAEPVNIAPTPRNTLELHESNPPADTLDRWHDWLYLHVQDFIERSDARFVDEGEARLPVPASPFRLGADYTAIHREAGGVDLNPRLDLDVLLQMPNLQRRLRLFITSDTVEESPSPLRSASSSIRAGLRVTPLHYLDFDVGIRADVPPVAFTSLRWMRRMDLGEWELLPFAKVYLETHKGLGAAAGASFDRWMDLWVFRSSSYANWRRDRADTEWTQAFTLARAQEIIRFGRYSEVVGGRDLARGFGMQALATGTRDTGTQRYEASVFFKQPTRTHWLYWHVTPLVTWDKTLGWHPDPGIRIGIDALFWDVSGR